MPLARKRLAWKGILNRRQQFGNFLCRMEVACSLLQKIGAGIPEVVQCRVIDLQEMQRFVFKNPHGQRVVGKQEERIRLALPERLYHKITGVANGSLLERASH